MAEKSPDPASTGTGVPSGSLSAPDAGLPSAVPPPTPAYMAPGEVEEVKQRRSETLPAFTQIVPVWTRNAAPESTAEHVCVKSSDGHQIEMLVDGATTKKALIFFSGAPFGAAPWLELAEVGKNRGMGVIQWSRPGYGESDRVAGRSIADAMADVAIVLGHCEVDTFVALGWSEGAPYAYACAAAYEQRCRAVAVVGGQAPIGAQDLDWTTGMANGRKLIAETAFVGLTDDHARAALHHQLDRRRADLVGSALDGLESVFGGKLASADEDTLSDTSAASLMASIRRAITAGVDGWIDDWLAQVGKWGFNGTQITVPVTVWHGEKDRIVPPSHGEWMAQHLPNSRFRLLSGDGHVSALTAHLEEIVADLDEQAKKRRISD